MLYKYLAINFCILLCFFALSSFVKPIDYFKQKDSIMSAYNSKMKKEKGLNVYGLGGAMTDDIQKIFIDYEKIGRFDVETSRQIFVKTTDDLIEKFNKDLLIRPFLHVYPVTIQEVKLKLSFHDKNSNWAPKGFVSYVSVNKNNLYYCTYDHETQQLIDMYHEPYDEAVRIVKSQSTLTSH